MKKQILLMAVAFALTLFTSCNHEGGSSNGLATPPVHNYLDPTTEKGWEAFCIPDFLNYPDDWTKLGLKGKVKEVTYDNGPLVRWLFDRDGRLTEWTDIHRPNPYSQNYNRDFWKFHYNDSGYVERSDYGQDFVEGRRSKWTHRMSAFDKYEFGQDGKPLRRAFSQEESYPNEQEYGYNKTGQCTSISTIRGKASVTLGLDDNGTITHIECGNTALPHEMTGRRNIRPFYDRQGRISKLEYMSVPTEETRGIIDSIFSTSRYEYNEQGNIARWSYDETVYPYEVTNQAVVDFEYEYDGQGNWTKKHMTTTPDAGTSFIGRYWTFGYVPQTLPEGSDSVEYWRLTITRNISYYPEETHKESARASQTKPAPVPSKLKGSVAFDAQNPSYWKVEKVVCTGHKNGGYAFTISGTFLKDCQQSMSNCSVTIGVKEEGKMKLTSVGSYFFPNGKAGEKFSFEIVGAFDGMCNVDNFQFLAILF